MMSLCGFWIDKQRHSRVTEILHTTYRRVCIIRKDKSEIDDVCRANARGNKRQINKQRQMKMSAVPSSSILCNACFTAATQECKVELAPRPSAVYKTRHLLSRIRGASCTAGRGPSIISRVRQLELIELKHFWSPGAVFCGRF